MYFCPVIMEERFETLRTLAAVAGENPNPVQFRCTPREMILHSKFDWEKIHNHLKQLMKEECVYLSQGAEFTISITQKGWYLALDGAKHLSNKKVS